MCTQAVRIRRPGLEACASQSFRDTFPKRPALVPQGWLRGLNLANRNAKALLEARAACKDTSSQSSGGHTYEVVEPRNGACILGSKCIGGLPKSIFNGDPPPALHGLIKGHQRILKVLACPVMR